MARKKVFNIFTKIRAALRDIFRYSPMHREALQSVEWVERLDGTTEFLCLLCNRYRPKEMARVDHQPPCGPLQSFHDLEPFATTLFTGTTRVICRPCHDRVTKEQKRKKAKT